MTLTDLLASIGGSLSLIVGLSCFTLFEIGELVCLLVHALLRTALHNRTFQWNVTVFSVLDSFVEILIKLQHKCFFGY